MNDILTVGCVQRVCHLDTERERSRDIDRLTSDGLAEGFPIEQLHHQKWMALRLTDVENRANIGMIDRRSSACLSLKTAERLRVSSHFRRQKLESHEAVQADVLGLVNHAHSAAAQLLDDAVMGN